MPRKAFFCYAWFGLASFFVRKYTGWVKKVSCCAVIDISKARQ